MKVQTITIGEYQISPSVAFCLYQFPSPLVTPPRSLKQQGETQQQQQQEYFNYFCLEDLFAIFDLHLIKQDLIQSYQHYPGLYCKDESSSSNSRSYIQTHVMADIALKHNLYTLVDLCRLDDKELLAGGAIPLLKMTTFVRLHAKPITSIINGFQPKQLDGTEWFFQQDQLNNVKLEPFSPTLPAFMSTPSNSPPRAHRLSSDILSNSSSSSSSFTIMSQQAAIVATPTTAEPVIKLPKPSSLLLKRLAPKHGHKKNLTIMTPSYNEDSVVHAIQSAPLRRTTIPPFHHRNNNKNKIVKKSSPSSLATIKSNNQQQRFINVPATASAVSAPWPQTSAQTRFPSPPIVPSQQPAWGQYRHQQQQKQQLKTANVPCFPRTPTVKTSSPQPTHMSQKQKFLQPFEYLYDHIEQTRVLKTTLDDQIRRSSSLMQTLQSSGTMVESLVRRQVRDMMDEKFESRLRECTERISRLEYRIPTTKDIPISPAVSPSPTTTTTNINKEQPPKDLLAQLMNRIDQLESKLDKQQ